MVRQLKHNSIVVVVLFLSFATMVTGGILSRKKAPAESEIDRLIRESTNLKGTSSGPLSPGSLYDPQARLADPYRELRAQQTNDLLTIVVADKATAIQSGSSTTQRKSNAKASIGPLFGKTLSPLAEMANLTGDQQLQGQGSTSRESSLSATLTARVVHVLPNGNLVVEAQKQIAVNSEQQTIRVRGIVRPFDLSTNNSVRSDRLANLEVWVSGRGIVSDAARRPNLLYRILMGVLPF